MERMILLTHTLQSAAVAEHIPFYLDSLQGVVTDTRRLTYGVDPDLYLAVFYIGDLEHESVRSEWVSQPNAWKFQAVYYEDARTEYPHRKFTRKEFRRQEAQKHAERIEQKIGSLLS